MLRKTLVIVLFVLSFGVLGSACGRFYDLNHGASPGIGLDPATWVAPHYPAATNGYYVFEEKVCERWGGACTYTYRYQAHPFHRDYNTWTYPVRIGREDAFSVSVDVADGTRYNLPKDRPYRRVVDCFPLYSESVGNRVQCTPRYFRM